MKHYHVTVTVEADMDAEDGLDAIARLAANLRDVPINSDLNDHLHGPILVNDIRAAYVGAARTNSGPKVRSSDDADS